jgi:hypothetical protein
MIFPSIAAEELVVAAPTMITGAMNEPIRNHQVQIREASAAAFNPATSPCCASKPLGVKRQSKRIFWEGEVKHRYDIGRTHRV